MGSRRSRFHSEGSRLWMKVEDFMVYSPGRVPIRLQGDPGLRTAEPNSVWWMRNRLYMEKTFLKWSCDLRSDFSSSPWLTLKKDFKNKEKTINYIVLNYRTKWCCLGTLIQPLSRAFCWHAVLTLASKTPRHVFFSQQNCFKKNLRQNNPCTNFK